VERQRKKKTCASRLNKNRDRTVAEENLSPEYIWNN